MKLHIRAAALFLILIGAGGLSPVIAEASDAFGPKIPPVPAEKGEQCVEPTDVMRKSHMDFILHERDETVHEGIRGRKHSLKACIDCHVNPGPDGKVATIESKEHFCSACHSYAAVKIDCFECHSDHPEEEARVSSMHLVNPHGSAKGTSMDVQNFQPLANKLIVEGDKHE